MSNVYPNTFQHPNIFIDQIAYLLTAQEQSVLTRAIREILGWHDKAEDRQARIALSVFVNGVQKKDGTRLSYGCGLGMSAVRKALAGLNTFNILIKVGDATNDGQMYKLNFDDATINWDALHTRATDKKQANKKRTKEGRGVLSDNRGIVGQKASVLSDNTIGVLSDKNNKPISNPLETHTTTTTGEKCLEFYQSRYGSLSGQAKAPDRQDYLETVKKYSSEWVLMALKLAWIDRKKGLDWSPAWGYIKAILKSWLSNGGPEKDTTAKGQTNENIIKLSRTKSQNTNEGQNQRRPISERLSTPGAFRL